MGSEVCDHNVTSDSSSGVGGEPGHLETPGAEGGQEIISIDGDSIQH